MNRSEMSQESSRSSDSEEVDPPSATETDAPDPYAPWAFRAFLAAEVVALVFYMQISRPMWFYLDEWDFLANRTAFNVQDLFRAHNEHWVTLPVLVYRGMWSIFGLNSYRPYQLLIVLAHLGAALLLRTVMRRVGVRPWTATVVATAFVFFGSGYQNIVLPFQITLVGSLIFGLVQLLLATHDGPLDRRDFFALAAGLAALMCSGVGVSMVVAVGVAVLLARGWRLALLQTVPLGAAYLLWYRWIGHVGYNGYRATPGQVASFVRSLIAASFSAMGYGWFLAGLLGALLVVGLFVAWTPLAWSEFRRRAAMPLGLLVGTVVLLTITGLGRAGIHTFIEKSRYLHLVAAMTLPALGVAADAIALRWRARGITTAAVFVVFLLTIPGNINVMVDYMHKPIVRDQTHYKRMMLALPRVPTATTVPRGVKPDQYLAHFVTIGWLLDGVKSGRIPKPAPLTPADVKMSDLRLSFVQSFDPLQAHSTCTGLETRLQFDLAPGQRIVVLAPSGSLRVVPAGPPVVGAYAFPLVTTVGNNLIAVRPVQFRLVNKTAPFGQICASAPILHAAEAAG